ncbi:MAG: hypothetical protein ACOC6G_01475 [Thermoproteota archaeon]
MPENKSVNQYSNIVDQDVIDGIKEVVGRLEGGIITHNTARHGGGVVIFSFTVQILF